MSSHTPYTIPYSGVAGQAPVAPAAHPPAPQDKEGGQGGNHQQPVVAGEPEVADDSHSKGKSVATGADDGPHDPVPARFATAVAAAAGNGITTATPQGDIQGSSSSNVEEQSADGGSNGQNSGKKNNNTPFGVDGADDSDESDDSGGRLLSSPTMATMSAQRRSNRTNPLLVRELQAAKIEIDRLRHALTYSQAAYQENNRLRFIIAQYQHTCHDLRVQIQSLDSELADANESNTQLTDLVVRLDDKIRNIDGDIFVTLPQEVQDMSQEIREEWKYQEWCKAFLEEPYEVQPGMGMSDNGNGYESEGESQEAGSNGSYTDGSDTGAINSDAINSDASNSDASHSDASNTIASHSDGSDSDGSDSDGDNQDFQDGFFQQDILLSDILGGLNILSPYDDAIEH
ncbi:hypothetical protein EsH8_IV_000125 [Colletotrichum jinshuiense]